MNLRIKLKEQQSSWEYDRSLVYFHFCLVKTT